MVHLGTSAGVARLLCPSGASDIAAQAVRCQAGSGISNAWRRPVHRLTLVNAKCSA